MVGRVDRRRLRSIAVQRVGARRREVGRRLVQGQVRMGGRVDLDAARPDVERVGRRGAVVLTTSVVAVVISAERTCPGVQSGCRSASSAAAPATCGDDIDVPAMAWKKLPGGPPPTPSGDGRVPGQDLDAGGGHVGLEPVAARAAGGEAGDDVALAGRRRPGGERGGGARVWRPGTPASASPVGCSRWTAGSKWLSVSVSDRRRVVQQHPGRAALEHVEALGHPAVGAALAHDDLAGEQAGGAGRRAARRCCRAVRRRARPAAARRCRR